MCFCVDTVKNMSLHVLTKVGVPTCPDQLRALPSSSSDHHMRVVQKPMLSLIWVFCFKKDDDDMPQDPTRARLAQVHPKGPRVSASRRKYYKLRSTSRTNAISDKTLYAQASRKRTPRGISRRGVTM